MLSSRNSEGGAKEKEKEERVIQDVGGCEERSDGLGWAGEEDECVGGGGQSLFIAACAQSGGLDAVGGSGVEESEVGK